MLQGQPNRAKVAVMGNGMIQHAACDIQPRYSIIVQVEDSRTVAIEDNGNANEAKKQEEQSERKAPLRAQ